MKPMYAEVCFHLFVCHQVVQQTQQRAVLVAGWSDLESWIGEGDRQTQIPDELLLVAHAPHDWLLPR